MGVTRCKKLTIVQQLLRDWHKLPTITPITDFNFLMSIENERHYITTTSSR